MGLFAQLEKTLDDLVYESTKAGKKISNTIKKNVEHGLSDVEKSLKPSDLELSKKFRNITRTVKYFGRKPTRAEQVKDAANDFVQDNISPILKDLGFEKEGEQVENFVRQTTSKLMKFDKNLKENVADKRDWDTVVKQEKQAFLEGCKDGFAEVQESLNNLGQYGKNITSALSSLIVNSAKMLVALTKDKKAQEEAWGNLKASGEDLKAAVTNHPDKIKHTDRLKATRQNSKGKSFGRY